jgi:hypothetical protein
MATCLDGRLKYWVGVLNLQEWNITLVTDCSPNDMTLSGVAGETEWSDTLRTAVIRIINPKDWGERVVPFNPEKTLVHELLHLKFSALDESGDPLRDKLTHRLIEDFAKVLITVKSEGWKADAVEER